MKLKRMLSIILVAAMLALPMAALGTFAAEEESAEMDITLGSSALKGAQVSKVYFGTYKQSSNGSGGYNVDPIKWRVLSSAEGKLFLLADQNLDVFWYNTAYTSVTWETCTMRSWLNGYGASSNARGIDYSSDSFIGTAFSDEEVKYISSTLLENADNPSYGTEGGNDTTDKVFLLSISEVQNTAYGFTNNTSSSNTRVSTNTEYVAGGGKIGGYMLSVGSADWWWLRSPGGGTFGAAYVRYDGLVSVWGGGVDHCSYAVRPAFNIDLSSVLFTSDAVGGKSPDAAGVGEKIFKNKVTTGSGEYKLTLLDASRSGFEAERLADGTISYSGATTGDNEYISAIIKGADGSVKYYGRLKNITKASEASGEVELELDGKLGDSDTLYIFNEQYNGDKMTDFASELIDVTDETENGVAWEFDEVTGTLSITGRGEMEKYSGEDMPWYDLAKDIKKVVIGEGITSIGKNAFNNKTAGFTFTEVELPSTLTSVGNYAFYECTSLEAVNIPASVSELGKFAFRGSTLKDHTFGRCGKTAYWMLDEAGVLIIGGTGEMFDYGSNAAPWASYKDQIKSVVICEGITNIGNCAFYECTNIESVKLASTVTSIGNYAFYSCKGLTEMTIPAAVSTIGAYAFRKCTAFTTATLENADGWSYGDTSADISAEALKTNYKSAWTRA